MPVVNRWECLKLLKDSDHYKHIPVIMISTSSHQKEINLASELGALCYFVTPNDFKDLLKVLKTITQNMHQGLADALSELQKNGSGHILACKGGH